MASVLCVALRSARLSRAATQASRRALPRRLSIGVIERSSRYQLLALKDAMVPRPGRLSSIADITLCVTRGLPR
jgi:hypothetical protein